MAKKNKAKNKTTKAKAQKPATPSPSKLPNAWRLTKASGSMLWRHKKVLGGISLIYGLLNFLLVQGLAATTDAVALKDQLSQVFTGSLSSLATSFSVLVVLMGSAGSGSNPAAGAYQFFLTLIVSLALIWALRQLYSGSSIRIRDAYYRGMSPLIPFVLVLLVIGLQLLPMLLGSVLYTTVIANGIAVHIVEQVIWLSVFLTLSLLSVYMISSSIIALYIVTLPDMTPIKALRSAKQLVKDHRWAVMRKLLFLPVILLILATIVMLPIILLIAPLAQWVFFLLTVLSLAATHTYVYTLYRELLGE